MIKKITWTLVSLAIVFTMAPIIISTIYRLTHGGEPLDLGDGIGLGVIMVTGTIVLVVFGIVAGVGSAGRSLRGEKVVINEPIKRDTNMSSIKIPVKMILITIGMIVILSVLFRG